MKGMALLLIPLIYSSTPPAHNAQQNRDTRTAIQDRESAQQKLQRDQRRARQLHMTSSYRELNRPLAVPYRKEMP